MHIQERIDSAINDGWSVEKISNIEYEFRNGVCKYTLEIDSLGNIKTRI